MGENNVAYVHNRFNHKEFNPVICIKIGEIDSMVTEISQTEWQVADDFLHMQKGEKYT